MSTQTLGQTVARRAQPIDQKHNRKRERIFFSGMTALLFLTVLLGFKDTYFQTAARPDDLGSWVIVAHAIVFSTYLTLFGVQVSLVAAHKVQLHKKLGLWFYGLTAIMVPLGLIAAGDKIKRDMVHNVLAMGADPLTFSMVSVMGMFMFGTLIAMSYAMRRKPDVHKRLALYATLSMMDAAIDRWPWPQWGLSRGWALWVYTLFLLLPIAYDLFSRRRVMAVTAIAAPYVWILHKLEIPIGYTRAWHVVAQFMLKHAL